MFEYHTLKPNLILKEYGSNIQKLTDYVVKIEDREERTKAANTLIELMKQINANGQRDTLENQQKYWDDLYIMSGFTLEVDSPFPMPEKESIGKKPKKMTYSTNRIKFKHYGKNMELLAQEAIALEDEEERRAAIIYIGKLMKTFYATWNKDIISDALIVKNIEEISHGKLTIALDAEQDSGIFDSQQREYKPRPTKAQGPSNRKGTNPNQKRRRSQN